MKEKENFEEVAVLLLESQPTSAVNVTSNIMPPKNLNQTTQDYFPPVERSAVGDLSTKKICTRLYLPVMKKLFIGGKICF